MFQSTPSILALSLAAASAVSAHQNLHQVWVAGVSPGYEVGVRMPPSNSPVTDVTSDDIACNVDGSTVPSGVDTIAANEGDEITVGWDTSSHPGPITHFLYGPVDDAAQASGVGEGWFKIDELDYANDEWANQVVMDAGGNYTFTLPTGLESGDYLLRSEMLALHGASTVGGAQFYIGCVQLTITGTGGGCSPTISLPGAYNAEDDNIYIPDVYNGFDPTTYTAPGGDVAVCGAGGTTPVTSAVSSNGTTSAAAATATATAVAISSNSTATASSSAPSSSSSAPASSSAAAQAPSVPTTLATVTASSAAAPSSTSGGSASGAAVALYGQCGGSNYSGATECASGSTCTVMNDYYSQCIAA
ncbi:glycosyl hydrolase family 61-domain-containing protein [Xylariomycetidae sp. FL2044]|nr:glycosyl hydrolase family 61-domain-containing protein [Xylariomycetidae sp. FL2044]